MVAAAKPKKRKATKGEQLSEIEELLTKIEAAEDACTTARLEFDDRKEAAKSAKGTYQTRVDELRDLCRTRRRWAEERKKQPLLEAAEKKQEVGAAQNGEES
jgi:prophage DNA circulation protein